MFEAIKQDILNRWMAVAMPNERIFVLYLASATVIAFLSWLYYRRKSSAQRPDAAGKGFFSYLLGREVYFHRSAVQDYLYFLANAVVYTGLISQLLISTHFFMSGFLHGFEVMFGERDKGIVPFSLPMMALYTIVYALLLDFSIFITHYAQHKIPLLWAFHKVHHSAEVLTPVTLYRMHPVDLFLSGLVASVLAGMGFAGFYYLTGETPKAFQAMGVNVIVFVFYLLGYNLRHSQIWLSYPAWLSHILISPAQHQIHHSTDPRHFDRNLGLIFAFWDKLFGTLYVPQGYEKISYGISRKEPNPFPTVAHMFAAPFAEAWKIILPGRAALQGALIFLAIGGFAVANYWAFYRMDRQSLELNRPLVSVLAEDLTWTEIQYALDEGKLDTVIIPTGGTEQNGPHMILGKHNYVVSHNASAIARRLRKTLVAPVIAYVPEDFHMEWAGTISVPETVFEGLLDATAESYIAHGFKNILFIGDSGGNQDGQKAVAERLSKRHAEDGTVVMQVDAYYAASNAALEALKARGYSLEQIGAHAGMRDTSEMLYIHPEGVRRVPRYIPGRVTGHNGDPKLASKKLGREISAMKVEAALKQIRPAIGRDESETEEEDGFAGLHFMEP